MQILRSSGVIVLCLLGWGVYAGMQRQSAVRSAVVAEHGLTGNTAAGYDGCQTAMSRKRLVNGGSTEEFCACFVQRAGTERLDGGEPGAIAYLQTVLDNAGRAPPLTNAGADANHRRLKYATALSSCIEDQRHHFADQADNARWCAAHKVSESDKRCSFAQ